ncbi:hypothetical protein OQA88_6782 [Cercophora sp. LCS_1]
MDEETDGRFFITWQLWQQMTFVLAMGIVAVFLAGLVKLWWNTRLMKKQAILDEEKKARLEEMRRTGLPLKRGNEIPFGIRAIQSGVQVQGIWISRPVSPTETASAKLAPSVTMINLDPEKATEYSDGPKPGALAMCREDQQTPDRTPLGGLGDGHPVESRVPYLVAKPSRPSPHRGVLNEDTLRRLDGHPHTKPTFETYAPTSSPRNPRLPSQRSSVSSSGESLDSQPRSPRSVSGRSYTSSRSSRLYTSRSTQDSRAGYHTAMSRNWPEEPGDPFDAPSTARTPSGVSALSRGDHGVRQHQELLVPQPTFGPGDLHVNRATRRVNEGFEVLPAGTFGVLHEVDGAVSSERPPNRLRKKSNGHSREEESTFNQAV